MEYRVQGDETNTVTGILAGLVPPVVDGSRLVRPS